MEMGRRVGWQLWPRRWLGHEGPEGMWIQTHGAGATGGKLHWLCNDTEEVITFCLTGANVDGRDSRELFACSSYPENANTIGRVPSKATSHGRLDISNIGFRIKLCHSLGKVVLGNDGFIAHTQSVIVNRLWRIV